MAADELPIKTFRGPAELEKWVATPANAAGVWIKFAKKDSGIKSINYAQALEVALCYGWIDGQSKPLDDQYYLQRFTPRRKRSIWSKRNVGLVEKLIAEGRMTAGGLREIEAAKADGRWQNAYDSPKNMRVPADLEAALAKDKKARVFFESINKTNRFAICFRIHAAKKAETRAKRIEDFVAMLRRGEVLYPSRARKEPSLQPTKGRKKKP